MSRLCSVEGCGHEYYARGLCKSHYSRDYRQKVVTRDAEQNPALFLLRKALPYRGEDCLIWPFGRDRNGYGLFTVGQRRLGVYAHREVCWATHGPPPTTQSQARHLCGNGHLGCVNPHHLVWGTLQDNMDDLVALGRSRRGELQNFAKLTAMEVRDIRRRASQGEPQVELSRLYGVTVSTINDIVHRRSWAWLD